MIPDTAPAVLAALNAAYATLGEDEAFALANALEQASAVVTIVEGFKILRDAPALDTAGITALAGCAALISVPTNNWHGLGGEAAALLVERAAEIAALPSAEPPIGPPPAMP